MAPYSHALDELAAAAWRPLMALHLRDPSAQSGSTGQSASDPVEDASQSATGAPTANNTIYLGIGVGVGGAILIAIVIVAVKIIRKRTEHKRAVTELDHRSEPVQMAYVPDTAGVPHPVSVARCGNLMPLHARAGWGALSSDETVNQPEHATQRSKKRNSISLPKRIRQRGIPMKRLKHLSAIMESPRSRSVKSPSPAVQGPVMTPVKSASAQKPGFRKTITMVHPAERDEDVFTAPGSPKPDVLPSFAIRSPGMYGAAIATDDRPKPPRSASVGALLGSLPGEVVFGPTARSNRLQMHARSISLGAPPNRPPSGPIPPLPSSAPHRLAVYRADSDESNRQGMRISRSSSSSQDSANSSVLLTSPILTMRDDEAKRLGSPSVEQLIADEDSAQLKVVKNRQWQNPHITGPRPMDGPCAGSSQVAPIPRNHASIRSNIAHYSSDSLADHRLSTISTVSTDSNRNRLSIPQIATADRVSISRVSSFNSLNGTSGGGVQRVTTPRKTNRQSSVSANGSPAERRKTSGLLPVSSSVLRDIHPNSVSTPSRQASTATQDSGRSSNGNPYQWDSSLPLMKPSALKGSPNSKGTKGHRRQNCVRISTLTPQILGPPPSRLMSPGIMCGIEEEGADGQEAQYDYASGRGFASNQRLSRSTSAASLSQQQNLRVQTLRASLTPSSPTLSTWTAYQKQQAGGLSSQNLDSQLSISISPDARTGSRQSDRSSAFSIPSFPSPSKATVANVQLHQPVPEFRLSRPSTDEPELDRDGSSSPAFALDFYNTHTNTKCRREQVEEEEEMMFASSPPLPISKGQEYDPAWPILTIPAPKGVEYDPASPVWIDGGAQEVEHSSPAYLPFAITGGMGRPCSDDDTPVSPLSRPVSYNANLPSSTYDEEPVSPLSRPTSYGGELPDTPPISPKTMPADFQTIFGGREEIPTTHATHATQPQRTTARALRSTEKLTSANASAIMATIPENPPTNIGFPSCIPILAPLGESDVAQQTTSARPRRQRAASTAVAHHHLQPLRQAPPPPPPISTPSADMGSYVPIPMPSPLNLNRNAHQQQQQRPTNTSPQGPRTEPPKSVLKNAMALRRMNSEIDVESRNSRRYTRLNREPSPLLPWIGSPDPSESCTDSFDFDFGDASAGAGAEVHGGGDIGVGGYDGCGGGHKSALDEIDMTDLDRRLDGALAGFEAGPPSTASKASKGSRASSVWEDGERFWANPDRRKPDWAFKASSPLPRANVTPTKRTGSVVYGGLMATPVGQLRMPMLDRPMSSIGKTPKSLYDSDGFLRT